MKITKINGKKVNEVSVYNMHICSHIHTQETEKLNGISINIIKRLDFGLNLFNMWVTVNIVHLCIRNATSNLCFEHHTIIPPILKMVLKMKF